MGLKAADFAALIPPALWPAAWGARYVKYDGTNLYVWLGDDLLTVFGVDGEACGEYTLAWPASLEDVEFASTPCTHSP